MEEFTSSSLQRFLDCRKKYYFSYVELLAPKRKAWALLDGEAYHLAMEIFNQETGRKVLSKPAMVKVILNSVKEIYDNVDTAGLSEDEVQEIDFHKAMMLGMIMGYIVSVEPDNVIKPEFEFKWGYEGITLRGKTDGVVEKNGKNWLKEYKTTGTTDIEGYKLKLDMDFQVDFYLSIVSKVLGIKLEGVLYEIVRKSLLKIKKNEDVEDYYKRIKEDYLKRPEFYYFKHYVYRSEKVLQDFEENDLKPLIRDVRGCEITNSYYKNKHQCNTYTGCAFKKLCLFPDIDMQEVMKTLFKKKDRKFEELKEMFI